MLSIEPAIFPRVDSNPYYHQPENTIKTLRGLWPSVLVSSNTLGRQPPPPPTAASDEDRLKSFSHPITLDDKNLTRPFRALMHVPREVDPNAAIAFQSYGEGMRWQLAPPLKQDMLSRAAEITGPRFKFTGELQRLCILAPQSGLNDPSKCVPNALIYEINARVHLPSLQTLLSRSFESKEAVLAVARDTESNFAYALGCLDTALLEAIDACAILGGRELPCWPPQTHWRGAYVLRRSCEPLTGSPGESARLILALVRRYERWGVPLWCIAYNKQGFRFDLHSDGRPTHSEGDERFYQAFMHSLKEKADRGEIQYTEMLTVVRHHETDSFSPADTPSLPTGASRSALEDAVLTFLDPWQPLYSTWSQFSSVMGSLLGKTIWTDKRHEELLHPAQFVSSRHETWTRIRDGLDNCLHTGVLLSGLEIPPPWYSSSSHGISMDGQGYLWPAVVGQGTTLDPPPLGAWHVLQLDDFSPEAGESVMALRAQLMERGVYGWSFAQSNLAFKDAQGRSIRHSRYVLNLVFKSPAELKAVALELQSSHAGNTQNSSARSGQDLGSLGVYNWEKHPRFLDIAFAKSTELASRVQLVRLAPSYPIPNSGSGDSNVRNLAVKTLIHSLRYEELFEASTFPPLHPPSAAAVASPPSTSPAPSAPSPPEHSRDLSKCSLDTLLTIAFSAREDGELMFLDVVRMQRLACILFCLSEISSPSFLSRVFRSDGPYLRILRYIGNKIRLNPQLGGSQYVSRAGRPNLSPYFEGVRLCTGGSVEIFLDLDSPESSIPMASSADHEAYKRRVEGLWVAFEKKLSPAEKKKKRRQGNSNSAAGPSGTSGTE